MVLALVGCTAKAQEPIGNAPQGIRSDFYKESVEIVSMIEDRMINVKQLDKKDDQKIDMFLSNYKPTQSPVESDVYAGIVLVWGSAATNLFYADQKGNAEAKVSTMDSYTKHMKNLKEKLNLK